jgi:hypothetical protein
MKSDDQFVASAHVAVDSGFRASSDLPANQSTATVHSREFENREGGSH